MILIERYQNVCVHRPDRSRSAVRQIDTGVRQSDIVDNAGNLRLRYRTADRRLDLVADVRRFLNAHRGFGTHMQLDLAGIGGWKKILPQPREQREYRDAGRE